MEFVPQSVQAGDLASVFFLILLEGLLSADNALVLAIMVRHLPRVQQQKALLYGLGGAFVFRFIAILLASYVLQLWWLQAIGAIYLLFLPIKHFIQNAQNHEVKPVGAGFWKTVAIVEMTDIAFAIDSVLAGVTFVNNRQDKIWVVYVGAIVGIILLRFAAGLFIKLLEKYPILDHVAYLLVGWVGVKLCFLAANNFSDTHPDAFQFPYMPHWLFWTGLVLISTIGTYIAIKRPNAEETVELQAGEEVLEDVLIDEVPDKQ